MFHIKNLKGILKKDDFEKDELKEIIRHKLHKEKFKKRSAIKKRIKRDLVGKFFYPRIHGLQFLNRFNYFGCWIFVGQ